MFIGEFRHSVDAKRRLSIPVKFRKELGKRAVLTKGLDSSLVLYPLDEWKKLAERLANLPIGQEKMRRFVRSRFADAAEVSFDSLGRILIPDTLALHAHLEKNVVVAGLYTRVELWDEERWGVYKEKAEQSADEIAEELGEEGLY